MVFNISTYSIREAAASSCNFTFYPEDQESFILQEDESRLLNYTVECYSSSKRSITLSPIDDTIVTVIPDQVSETFEAYVPQMFNATINGLQFGRTDVNFSIADDSGRDSLMSYNVLDSSVFQVTVVREASAFNLAFIIVLGIMILLYNFAFGCKVDPAHIKSILKRPVAPVIGASCQFLIMAPLSFGVAMALKLDPMTGLGLLAIGCSPGGGGSNVFAFLLDADLELSITLTFFSTLLSLGMTPFWMWALGRFFYDDNARLTIPIANVFSSLAIVILPVSGGVILRHFKPAIAEKIARGLSPFTAIIGVTFISLGIYVYYYALVRITWRTLVACTVVPICGYTLGLIAGYLGKQGKKRSMTISLETGFQNLALALFILNTSLEPPESDFAGVVPICYTFLSGAFPSVVFIIMWTTKTFKNCNGSQKGMELATTEQNGHVNLAVISTKI